MNKKSEDKDKRDIIVAQLKDKCSKEIIAFRQDENIKKLLSEFDKNAIIKAAVAEALERFINSKNAFNRTDFYTGRYILSTKCLMLFTKADNFLNYIFEIFCDDHLNMINPINLSEPDFRYSINLIDEILLTQKLNDENNQSE